jgi:hypothetical protein
MLKIFTQKIKLNKVVLFLFLFILIIIAPLIFFTTKVASFSTIILLLFITSIGVYLCNRTIVSLKDKNLKLLTIFWLLKIIITIALLYFGWMPELDSNFSSNWGYDPQRFYEQSYELSKNGWDNSFVGLNFKGILYYYAIIFSIFGHNPIIPALINILVTLLGFLYLIHSVYAYLPNRTKFDYRISFILLIPEVLWFDVMTSRESLMSVLLIFSIITVGNYLSRSLKISLLTTILTLSFTLLCILAVRTTMIIPVIICIMTMIFLIKNNSTRFTILIKLIFIFIGIAAIFSGSIIQQLLGSGDIDYISTFDRLQGSNVLVEEQVNWSQNSIGLMFIPNGLLQSIIFIPVRMVLYLLAPLPNISIPLSGLFEGSWGAYQSLFTTITSILYLIGFPFVLAASELAWKVRNENNKMLIIPITFWVVFVTVTGGNHYIHERYRLMATMLLFTTMWIGYTRCSLFNLKKWILIWSIILFLGVLFYITIKLI